MEPKLYTEYYVHTRNSANVLRGPYDHQDAADAIAATQATANPAAIIVVLKAVRFLKLKPAEAAEIPIMGEAPRQAAVDEEIPF